MRISSRERRLAKRTAAKERQEAYNALSDEERLQKLIDSGHDHCAEAGVLRKKIENAN